MKECSRCNIKKPLKSFDKQKIKGKYYYKPYCCGCKSKRHRKINPEVRQEINKRGKEKYKANRLMMKQQILQSIGQLVCKNCGYSDIRALTFHHRNRKEKGFEISKGFTHSYSLETLIEEARKCDVLCMNCHVIFHQINGWTLK